MTFKLSSVSSKLTDAGGDGWDSGGVTDGCPLPWQLPSEIVSNVATEIHLTSFALALARFLILLLTRPK